MKKLLAGIVAGLIAITSTVFVGCNLTSTQIQAIAQSTGLGAAVTWIAYDNPDTNAKSLVTATLVIIEEKAGSVQTGTTYTAVLYPEIEKYVATGAVEAQYKPLVLAGSLAMLNGLDMLFAFNPTWKTQEGLALNVTTSFCKGAIQGLGLSDKDPSIVQAKMFSASRAKILQK